jgi:hypothetical protein
MFATALFQGRPPDTPAPHRKVISMDDSPDFRWRSDYVSPGPLNEADDTGAYSNREEKIQYLKNGWELLKARQRILNKFRRELGLKQEDMNEFPAKVGTSPESDEQIENQFQDFFSRQEIQYENYRVALREHGVDALGIWPIHSDQLKKK